MMKVEDMTGQELTAEYRKLDILFHNGENESLKEFEAEAIRYKEVIDEINLRLELKTLKEKK